MSDTIMINGIDGDDGDYCLPALTIEDISNVARAKGIDASNISELRSRSRQGESHFGPEEGVDEKDLAQSGWGVIFAHSDGDRVAAIKGALKELLDRRREQAGDLYKEYVGPDAYRPGESKGKFLARHGMGAGPASPKKVPYYLLIVGSPSAIPYQFQYQLDVQYAVGRIHFDNDQDYANYAHSVVQAEKGELQRSRSVSLFGPKNPGDLATALSASELVDPLAKSIQADKPDWQVRTTLEGDATKANLEAIMRDDDGPALLFTASHGMSFGNGKPRQRDNQGALVCQEWPGAKAAKGKPVPGDWFFSGADIDDRTRLGGLISFHFACFGAGTPQKDDFAHRAFEGREDIAPEPFLARLPERMLAHPKGGALAAIGHVERAWGYSFNWPDAGRQIGVFQSTVKRLMEGHPVGSAMEYFNQRYAELSSDLSTELENIKFGMEADDLEVAAKWTANNDARGYVVIGDPAVKLAV